MVVIAPDKQHMCSFVRQLAEPKFFGNNGEWLHEGRNEIKLFEWEGERVVVKRYGHISFFNRAVYGKLRSGKACRAFRNALALRKMGVDTPAPIAFVEQRFGGLLRYSYFVSEYTAFRPVSEKLGRTSRMTDSLKPLVTAVAGFLYDIHSLGIEHKDLNVDNILYRRDESGRYRFSLIDCNRMSFKRRALDHRERMHNMRRLSCSVPIYCSILSAYAAIDNKNENGQLRTQMQGIAGRYLFELRQTFKRWLRTKRRNDG